MFLLNVALFALIFGFPLIPGLLEILRPRDNAALVLDAGYSRDPHFFGDSMRAKVEPLLALGGKSLPYEGPFLGRRGERAQVGETIVVPPRSKNRDVLIALDRIEVDRDASVLDLYGLGSIEASNGSFARTVLSDGDVHLGDGCNIGRWVDAAGGLSVGASCNLGRSATAGGRMILGSGTRFTRLFGMPILAEGDVPPDLAPDVAPASPDDPHDVIATGDLRIEDGRSVAGTVKAYGSLTIGAGAHVVGNAIARGDVTIERGARVDGHIFSEGRLTIGPSVRIGLPGSSRTAYGERGVTLAPSAQVFGWLLSDRAGTVAE